MKAKRQGFTIIEMLFSVTVLGVMLAIVLTTIVGMLRFYTFSNYIRENQQNGRNLLDTMTREVRFGTMILPNEIDPIDKNVLCVADDKNKVLIRYKRTGAALLRSQYTYANLQLTDQVKKCDGSGGAVAVSVDKQVSGKNMTVINFAVSRTAGAPGTLESKAAGAKIDLKYGTGSVNASGGCEVGDIYCAVLTFTTAVNVRGGAAQ